MKKKEIFKKKMILHDLQPSTALSTLPTYQQKSQKTKQNRTLKFEHKKENPNHT